MDKALVNRTFELKKFPGKGGWTYAEIPEITQDSSNPFGWVTVKGSIDDYHFKQFKLMPMGNGQLFFSVNAKIRKMIKKKAGDTVVICLYPDYSSIEIPEEIKEVLKHESEETSVFFDSMKDSEKKAYLDWIYKAKSEDTIVQRIVKMISKLKEKKKFYE